MKTQLLFFFIIFLFYFSANPLFSSNLIHKVNSNSENKKQFRHDSSKGNYDVEEATRILRSSKLGNIKLDYDNHVYKCMEIARKAKNLEGAVDALIVSNTNLGRRLDDKEVEIIIKISRIDTDLYYNIMVEANRIGKKNITINEHYILYDLVKKGYGKYILKGLERAIVCNYKPDGDLFRKRILDLLIKVGKLKYEERIYDIYNSMKTIGFTSKLNSQGLEVIYTLYFIEGDVANKIANYLKQDNKKNRKEMQNKDYILLSGFIFYSNDPFGH